MSHAPFSAAATARLAGGIYLVLIACGLWAELGARSALIVPGDAQQTAARILAAPGLFRGALAADTLMAICDVALGVLLFVLFRPFAPVLAGLALAFRLVQAAMIGVFLVVFHAAFLWLETRGAAAGEGALALLSMHAHGYDLGLVFFGVNCLLTGALILRSGAVPRVLGALIGLSGVVYIVGSAARFLAPGLVAAVQPAYAVPLAAELAFALWLLVFGVRREPPGNR